MYTAACLQSWGYAADISRAQLFVFLTLPKIVAEQRLQGGKIDLIPVPQRSLYIVLRQGLLQVVLG